MNITLSCKNNSSASGDGAVFEELEVQIRWVRVLVMTIMKDKERLWKVILTMENTISVRYAQAVEDHLSALTGIKTYSINSLVFPGTAENRSRAVSATYPLEDLEDASARAAATVKPSDVCPKWANGQGRWWLRSGSGSAAVWSRADQAGCPTICTRRRRRGRRGGTASSRTASSS